MIIFTDIITGDEMVSDSFEPKEIDGAVYEVECAMIEVGGESFGPSYTILGISAGASPLCTSGLPRNSC